MCLCEGAKGKSEKYKKDEGIDRVRIISTDRCVRLRKGEGIGPDGDICREIATVEMHLTSLISVSVEAPSSVQMEENGGPRGLEKAQVAWEEFARDE